MFTSRLWKQSVSPAAVSTGIGSQTQRPLATVIVGGMFLAPALLSIMVPVFRIALVPGSERG